MHVYVDYPCIHDGKPLSKSVSLQEYPYRVVCGWLKSLKDIKYDTEATKLRDEKNCCVVRIWSGFSSARRPR